MTQSTSPTNASENASPRPISAAAARQSWRELPVRVWMLITFGVLVVVIVVGSKAISQGLSDRELLNNGIAVEAKIEQIYGAKAMVARSVQRDLDISYQLPGETERRVIQHVMLTPVFTAGEPDEGNRPKGALLKPTMAYMNPGDRFPVRVDPKDPRRWTDRVDPAPWVSTLAVPLLLLPIVAILALMAFLQRKAFLNVYQNGVRATAKAVDVTKSALTPGQRVVKVGVDGKVLVATLPASPGEAPIAGQSIDVYLDRSPSPRRAVIARAYDPSF